MSPHDVRGGDVRITVTDDYIEKLDLSGVPEKVRDLVRARVEPLVGKRHLTAEEYQRRTILIGTLAGVNGGAVVAPGVSDGASTLVIQVVEPPVVSSALVSNRLPKDYGTFMFSKSVALNNALGLGEQLSANVASGPDFDRFFRRHAEIPGLWRGIHAAHRHRRVGRHRGVCGGSFEGDAVAGGFSGI